MIGIQAISTVCFALLAVGVLGEKPGLILTVAFALAMWSM